MSSGKKRGKFVSHAQLVLKKEQAKSSSKSIEESNFNDSGFKSVQINVTDLPSKFLPYPSDAVIKYRPYYFEEIMNHDQSKNLTYREEVDYVLSGVYTNFNKYDLTLSDYLYINLLRRMSNVGDYDIRVKYLCKGCGNISENVIKASQIDIDYLEVPKLPITVTFSSEKKYSFNPITIGSHIELVEENFKNKSVSILSKCCVNAPYEEIYEFIRTLTDPLDVALAKKVDRLVYHSLKPMDLTCSYVHKEFLEKDGYNIKTLNKLRVDRDGKDQLLALFNKYKIKLVEETEMLDFAFRDLVKKMALIKETPCKKVSSIELDGGGLFIGPFCDYKRLVKDRICYGD